MSTTESPVVLTPNPYRKFFIQLGRDEIYAWVLSTVATGAVSLLLYYLARDMALSTRALILAFTGPIAEKPGLFFEYVKNAFREYSDTDDESRQPRSHYVRKAFRDGMPTLLTDVTCHDPAYALLFWLLMHLYGGTSSLSAAVIAGVSFFTAVAIASTAKVLFVDAMFQWHRYRLRKAGFVQKSYYESRFWVDPDGDENFLPENVLARLQKKFNLPIRTSYTYRDVYMTKYSDSVYNGRKPYLRFRQRFSEDGTISKQAMQVMYTRSREIGTHISELYRCYATRKEKFGFDFPLAQAMPWKPEGIPDGKASRFARRLSNAGNLNKVGFTRHVVMAKNGLFISIDIPPHPPEAPGSYWLELKSRTDLDSLRETSDYIAWKLPVRATTKTKCDALWSEKPSHAEAQEMKGSERA